MTQRAPGGRQRDPHDNVPGRVDLHGVDHPELGDAHLELGVDHSRQRAADVVLGGCRTRDGCVHGGAGVVRIGVLHRAIPDVGAHAVLQCTEKQYQP